MSIKLAAATHTPTGRHVDVVQLGAEAWTVQDQFDDTQRWSVPASTLDEIWPNTEVLDVLEEMSQNGFEPREIFWIIRTMTRSTKWAALLLRKWAELY